MIIEQTFPADHPNQQDGGRRIGVGRDLSGEWVYVALSGEDAAHGVNHFKPATARRIAKALKSAAREAERARP